MPLIIYPSYRGNPQGCLQQRAIGRGPCFLCYISKNTGANNVWVYLLFVLLPRRARLLSVSQAKGVHHSLFYTARAIPLR